MSISFYQCSGETRQADAGQRARIPSSGAGGRRRVLAGSVLETNPWEHAKGDQAMNTLRHCCLLTACLVGTTTFAMAALSTATADALNPPPPSFVTCKATGSGTTCRAAFTSTFAFPKEFSCGAGAGRFYLDEAGTSDREVVYIYDVAGNLIRRITRVTSLIGTFTNSKTGNAIPESGQFTITHQYLTPGDLSTDQTTFNGAFAVVIDPDRGVVLQDAGHIVFAPAGDVLKEGGKHDYQHSDIDQLCAALS
jgi:hypothetical protein